MPQSSFPFRVVTEGFRYLGIFITASFNDLFNKNVRPLIDKCKLDLAHWSSLPLSLSGRVNLVKMVILPKFLYLFQHIPIFIRQSFFQQLDQTISSFLWLNKPPRIRKAVLQLPKKLGGLALPNPIQYYWACNINKLINWIDRGVDIGPSWVQLELRSSKFSLQSLLTARLPLKIHNISQNPVVTNSLKIWIQFRKHYGLNEPSTLAPVVKKHLFPPSLSDPTFNLWRNKGLLHVKHLYKDNIFTNFTELATRFALPQSNFFRFLQARHFVKTNYPHFPNHPPGSLIDSLLTLDPAQKRSISVIYNAIDSLNPDQTTRLKQTWEEELGAPISDNQWDQILKLVHTSSICARHSLLQCKVLFRVHYTNVRLAKIYPDTSDSCNRCKQSPANHTHMFWSCLKLTGFWRQIFDTLSTVLDIDLNPEPCTVLFGSPPLTKPQLPASKRRVLAFTTLLARRLILFKWKHVLPPSHNSWLREVLTHIKLEKVRFSLAGSDNAFNKTWQPFLEYLDRTIIHPDSD